MFKVSKVVRPISGGPSYKDLPTEATAVPFKTFNYLRRFIGLPASLLKNYRYIEDDDELILDGTHWTFFSKQSIQDRHKELDLKYADVAIRYGGMGYVYVLAWDLRAEKFFIRLDGGSNGFDVLHSARIFQDPAFRPDTDKMFGFNIFIILSKLDDEHNLSDYVHYS